MTAEKSLQRAALTMVILNGLSMPMMLSAVNVALPAIAESLAMDAVLVSWVPMGYLMASAALVLLFGRLADLFGRKRIFLIGTASLIVTSIFAAFAQSGEMLIALRILQGASAAMLYATYVALISSVFSPAQRGRMIGLTVSVIYLGLTCGPLIGGWCTETFGWQSTFLIHVPLCLAALIVGLFFVPGEWRAEHPGRFDYLGAALYIGAIVAFMYGVSALPEGRGILLIVAGLVGFWLFFRHQHGRTDPLIDVTLFYTNRIFTFSCLAAFIMYTATFANVVLISLYLQYLQGLTPKLAGVVMIAQPATMTLFSGYAGKLSDSIEPRVIASAGLTITAVGLAFLASLDTESSIVNVVLCLMATGLGFALFTSPNANAIMGSVEPHHYGAAGASVATTRILGQTCSMGIVAMMFALTMGPVQITPAIYGDLARGIRLSFILCTALCIPGIFFSLVRGRVRSQEVTGG
jgi:EmrB/QacA subfamily drug resistance transporter